jgi:aminopeptidase S
MRLSMVAPALAAALLLIGCGGAGHPAEPEDPLAAKLASEISDAGAMGYLQALQRIADQNGGNRASPSAGYALSVDYVAGVLRRAGYEVSTPTYQVSREHDGDEYHLALRNVVAQTRTGDPNRVVMAGAHLDSVRQGPGIVDDGSGVATLLEIAQHLGAAPPVHNAVRFAFFGSEEDKMQGSKGYVQSLPGAEREKIMLYLNVDMVASPNAGYFVQGGKGERESQTGAPGSAIIAGVLSDQLAKTGVTPQTIQFVGDDERAFVRAGIPTGGAENGDAKTKTEEQAQAWGGRAGEPYDPCYHSACDRVDNVNRVVLNHYLHAIGGTLVYFATSRNGLSP